MNKKNTNKPLLTIIILLSILLLNFLAVEHVEAQSVQASASGYGTLSFVSMDSSRTGLAVSYFMSTAYKPLTAELTGYRTNSQWSGNIIVSIYQGNSQPETQITSAYYSYNSLSTTPSTVRVAFEDIVLNAGFNYWLTLTYDSTPPSAISTNWAVSSAGQTYRANSYGDTMYRQGAWSTLVGQVLNFNLHAQITDAPTPSPSGPTITPPPPTIPPPPEAYAYASIAAEGGSGNIPFPMGNNNGRYGNGVDFIAQDYIHVDHVDFYLARVGTATGAGATVTAKIYQLDGSTVGANLANSTTTYSLDNLPNAGSTQSFYFNNVYIDVGRYIVTLEINTQNTGGLTIGVQYSSNVNLWRTNSDIFWSNGQTWTHPSGYNRFVFSLYATPESLPTPTPTPGEPTPTPTLPPESNIDDNTFSDLSHKLSIATESQIISTANAAILQPFTANGQYVTSVTFQLNRMGTIPVNGEFIAGIASGMSNGSFYLITTSAPIVFNLIPTTTSQVTFEFDGTTYLESGVQYWLVLAANTPGLSGIDDTPACLFAVVRNATASSNLVVYRGGNIQPTDPLLEMWYVVRGTQNPRPTPTVPPSVTPSPNPQDSVPNPVWTWSIDTTSLWQPLLAWDFAGFVFGCWTYSLGGSFFYILVLIISVALYIRYQNLTVLIVLWFIIGSLYAALIPLAGPVGISFIIFGFAGLLYKALAEPKT